MPTPFSFALPVLKAEQAPPAAPQDLGLLRDAHGAPLVRMLYCPATAMLHTEWFGNLTSETVIKGVKAGLPLQKQLQCPLLLNDKSAATGDWTEAMSWLEYEWLPQAQNNGLRAFAYVFAPDMHNQMSALEFFARASQHLPVQLFYDKNLARQWLEEQL